ncbi:MAG: hypothetical protein OEW89_05030 [Gammaproteobacteria bacterium]|nr:hypothetical protein [Gammaproteobacteria bacterium]MDH5592892.1 hypothetical protein [Gammaproteobacteria bacterium]MDH5614106.1 hypothetical protein [Gammaproteobacteria bacterium]
MGIIRELIGPKSKYEKDIPFTYEARINIIDGEEDCKSYLADTICALVEYLDKNNIQPDEVKIYEIFQQEEKELETGFCISKEGNWLSRSELCQSFKEHYPGRIDDNGCVFEDREHDVSGP